MKNIVLGLLLGIAAANQIDSVTCWNNILEVDCIADGHHEFTHQFAVTECSPDIITCELINEKCGGVVEDYVAEDCNGDQGGGGRRLLTSLSEDVRRLMYPPINPTNDDQMCTFFDGQINKWGTQFTKYFTPRWCWGWLCTNLPNFDGACHCVIYDNEFWYGELDLSNFQKPHLTFDHSFVADFLPETNINIKIDCGNGWKPFDKIILGPDSKKDEFKCEGHIGNGFTADNYDYFDKYLPTECQQNNFVKLKFKYKLANPGMGKWFGIKNLCMVDSNHPVNKCIGDNNPFVDVCHLHPCQGGGSQQCLHLNDWTCQAKINYGYGVTGCTAGTKWCGPETDNCGVRDCSKGSCVSNIAADGTCWPKLYENCYPGTHEC